MKILKRMAIGTGVIFALLVTVVIALYLWRDMEVLPLNAKARMQAPSDFIQLEEGITHYEIAGPDTGQVVVLIHGFSVPSYVWGSTFGALANAGFRVLRFDAYGRGYSDRPAVDYDRELYEKQINGLLDKLNLQTPVDLAGVSMGGAIATGFAARYPDKVHRLVLIDPFHKAIDAPPIPEFLGYYLMSVFYVPQMPANQMTDFFRPERFPEWKDRFREQMQYEGFARGIVSTVYHFLSQQQLHKYHKVASYNIPVMLVWGKEDQTIPFSSSKVVRKAIDPKVFLAVEKARHLPHLEQPEIVNKGIISFLTETEKAAEMAAGL